MRCRTAEGSREAPVHSIKGYEPMRLSNVLRAVPGAIACLLASAAVAEASVPHTVQPGETLWSIAAASNLTTRALAAANGVSPESGVAVGSTVRIPSESEAASALAGTGAGGASPGPQAPVSPQTAAPAQTSAPAPGSGGSMGPSGVGSIASANGVSPSLAAAIAHQESGFENSAVSPAGAQGVMQVLPGTFDYVDRVLGHGAHDPSSPQQNVRAGVLYLRQLLGEFAGDERSAVASYYQGPTSVRQSGLLPDTERYVANVMALRSRYGG